jgi:hypothetical protein
MEIIVEKAVDSLIKGGTCNCGSNNSGTQGSMCRAAERSEAKAATPLTPPLSTT